MDEYINDIYYTLIGELEPEYQVPGVENAFAPGSVCDRAYTELSAAYARLRHRLNAGEEDRDVETLLHAGLTIQRDLCLRMFRLGSNRP